MTDIIEIPAAALAALLRYTATLTHLDGTPRNWSITCTAGGPFRVTEPPNPRPAPPFGSPRPLRPGGSVTCPSKRNNGGEHGIG